MRIDEDRARAGERERNNVTETLFYIITTTVDM